jgi:hypothetical protein
MEVIAPAREPPRFWRFLLIGLLVLVLMGIIEKAMGRIGWSKSGQLLLWVNETNGPETSQQLFDWYSVTHVEHGFVLYFIAWLAWRLIRGKEAVGRVNAAWEGGSFLFVLIAEAGWEVLENSPVIIERYRSQTAAVGYNGDTILNSVSDVLCCMLGWWIARKLPWWVTLLVFIGTETLLAFMVRDNFLLNVLMLTVPVEAVKRWQNHQ